MNAFVRPAKHVFVPIEEIDLGRTIRPYNAAVVSELAHSIRAIGLQTPLTCIVRDGKHILVSGRNRLEALRLVGAEQAPVRIVDFDDVEARLWAISENLHRAELSLIQRSEQIAEYAALAKERREAERQSAQLEPSDNREAERVSAQLAPKRLGGRPESGDRLAARDLGITRDEVRRAQVIASLPEETKEAARSLGQEENQAALVAAAKEPTPEAQVAALQTIAERGRVAPAPSAKALRDLVGISGGELALWIKITTPRDRPHVIRVLEMAAAILRDELEAIENGSRHPVEPNEEPCLQRVMALSNAEARRAPLPHPGRISAVASSE